MLIGPPGVGKGTQGALLEAATQAKGISSGNIFRAEMEAMTDLGRLAKRYIDKGELVPDNVTIEMMAKRLQSPEIRKGGFILDGFPRNVDQAEALDTMLDDAGLSLNGVVALIVDDEVVVQRLSGRLGCTKCGAIYHRDSKPPKREWTCDNCNSPLFVRHDDEPETIRERLRIYHHTTKPVITYYADKGILHRIDGTLPPSEVHQAILCALKP